MATATSERDSKYEMVEVPHYTADDVEAHWRGFDKVYLDGKIWAVCCVTSGRGWVFGPFSTGRAADLAIIDFYDSRNKDRDT